MRTFLLTLPALASSFVVSPRTCVSRRTATYLAAEENDNEESEGLVLDGLDKEMNQFASSYAFTETDFLAAARKRAEEKRASVNSGANDEDWKKIAGEKKEQVGEIDDWENSRKEAGNADSQILMFTEPPADGEDEEGEGGDPKLLLF
jgi:hypothetical protein